MPMEFNETKMGVVHAKVHSKTHNMVQCLYGFLMKLHIIIERIRVRCGKAIAKTLFSVHMTIPHLLYGGVTCGSFYVACSFFIVINIKKLN